MSTNLYDPDFTESYARSLAGQFPRLPRGTSRRRVARFITDHWGDSVLNASAPDRAALLSRLADLVAGDRPDLAEIIRRLDERDLRRGVIDSLRHSAVLRTPWMRRALPRRAHRHFSAALRAHWQALRAMPRSREDCRPARPTASRGVARRAGTQRRSSRSRRSRSEPDPEPGDAGTPPAGQLPSPRSEREVGASRARARDRAWHDALTRLETAEAFRTLGETSLRAEWREAS